MDKLGDGDFDHDFAPGLTPEQLEIFGGAPEYLCYFDKWIDYFLFDLHYVYPSEMYVFSLNPVYIRYLRWNNQMFRLFSGSKDDSYLNDMSFDPMFVDYYADKITRKASYTLSQLVNFGSIGSSKGLTDPEVRPQLVFISVSILIPKNFKKATSPYLRAGPLS